MGGVSVAFPESVPDSRLAYAVIVARAGDKWVLARHRDRQSLECPGGHREPGEKIELTARRELYEETGAVDFTLAKVGPYAVTREGETGFGMLYAAQCFAFGPLPESEIGEIGFQKELPENWTYPEIQPVLLEKARGLLPPSAAFVRQTRREDLDEIMPIFDRARALLASRGVDQWQDGYPQRFVIENDLARGESYVLEEKGRILGTFMLTFNGEPTYREIDGAWRLPGPYAVLHRIAVAEPGRGLGVRAFQAAEAICRQKGVWVLRADTHENNLSMQRLLAKRGFVRCGGIRLANGDPRWGYDLAV